MTVAARGSEQEVPTTDTLRLALQAEAEAAARAKAAEEERAATARARAVRPLPPRARAPETDGSMRHPGPPYCLARQMRPRPVLRAWRFESVSVFAIVTRAQEEQAALTMWARARAQAQAQVRLGLSGGAVPH